MTQEEKAQVFRMLHQQDGPLILTNVWDAGSARVVAECGATAIATGSWSVAAAHGFEDREKIPLELVLSNLERIVATADLPVSLDFEAGYSKTAKGVGESVEGVIEAGAIGINLEDQIIGGEGRYSIEEQCERIAAVRQAAEKSGIALFINARTDIYLQSKPSEHSEAHLAEALERGHKYSNAGADGFFVPGLRDPLAIKQLCKELSLPINIMLTNKTPAIEELTELGVKRISQGGYPYIKAMKCLTG